MSVRPWILGTFLVIGVGVDGYLVHMERVAPSEKRVGHIAEKADPLIDLKYIATEREGNLKVFGLSGEALKRGVKRIKDLETEQNKGRLALFLDEINDPDRAADAFCGTGTVGIPPRYALMGYLVKDERGRRDALDLDRVSRLDREEWSKVVPIDAVYAELEMGDVREQDATVMGIAAILLEKEQEALERNSPWGSGLGSRWSWEKVRKDNPGIEDRVIEYLALMHLSMEVAMGEGGFCTE